MHVTAQDGENTSTVQTLRRLSDVPGLIDPQWLRNVTSVGKLAELTKAPDFQNVVDAADQGQTKYYAVIDKQSSDFMNYVNKLMPTTGLKTD